MCFSIPQFRFLFRARLPGLFNGAWTDLSRYRIWAASADWRSGSCSRRRESGIAIGVHVHERRVFFLTIFFSSSGFTSFFMQHFRYFCGAGGGDHRVRSQIRHSRANSMTPLVQVLRFSHEVFRLLISFCCRSGKSHASNRLRGLAVWRFRGSEAVASWIDSGACRGTMRNLRKKAAWRFSAPYP